MSSQGIECDQLSPERRTVVESGEFILPAPEDFLSEHPTVVRVKRYIEQNLDRNVTWDEARAWLEAQHRDAKGKPSDWLLLAVPSSK